MRVGAKHITAVFWGPTAKLKRQDRAQTAATSRARCKAVGSSLTITTSSAYIKIWTCMEPARPAHVTPLQTRLISAAKSCTKTLSKNPLRTAAWPIPFSTSHESENFEETRTAAVRWETRSSIRCHRPPDTPARKSRSMAPSRHATSKALRISKKRSTSGCACVGAMLPVTRTPGNQTLCGSQFDIHLNAGQQQSANDSTPCVQEFWQYNMSR